MGSKHASVVIDTSTIILTTLTNAGKLTSVPFLQSAAQSALDIVEIIQNVRNNKSAFKRLAEEACALVYIIICTQGKTNSAATSPTYLSDAKELSNTLKGIADFASTQTSKSMLMRVVQSKSDAGTIQEYRERLKHSLDVFGLKSSFSMQDSLADIQRKLTDLQNLLPERGSQGSYANDHQLPIPRTHEERDDGQHLHREEVEGERFEADRGVEQLERTGDTRRLIRERPQRYAMDQDICGDTSGKSDNLESPRLASKNLTREPEERPRAKTEHDYWGREPGERGETVRRITLEERQRDDIEDGRKIWEDTENHRRPNQYSGYPRVEREPEEHQRVRAEHEFKESERTGKTANREELKYQERRLQREKVEYERKGDEENHTRHVHPNTLKSTRNTYTRNPFRPSTSSLSDEIDTPDSIHSQTPRHDNSFENTFPFTGQKNQFPPPDPSSPSFTPPVAPSWHGLPTFPPWYGMSGGLPIYGVPGTSSIGGSHNVYVNSPVNANSGNTTNMTVTNSHNKRSIRDG